MDKLSFRMTTTRAYDENKDANVVETLLNGIPLKDIVDEYQPKAAMKAGEIPNSGESEYHYPRPQRLYNEFLDPFFSKEFFGEDRIEVMTCSCEIEMCWSLFATIEYTATEVIWKGFCNPHRENVWDYSVFPSFRFDREHYREAIGQLKDLACIGGELPEEIGYPIPAKDTPQFDNGGHAFWARLKQKHGITE
jgi:hypothetical protein